MPQIILDVSESQLESYKQAFEEQMDCHGIKGEVTDVEALLRECFMADLEEPYILVRRHMAEDALDDLAGLNITG